VVEIFALSRRNPDRKPDIDCDENFDVKKIQIISFIYIYIQVIDSVLEVQIE
jgi:hypothetical protein